MKYWCMLGQVSKRTKVPTTGNTRCSEALRMAATGADVVVMDEMGRDGQDEETKKTMRYDKLYLRACNYLEVACDAETGAEFEGMRGPTNSASRQ